MYSVLGQVFQDKVTTLGSGVDGTVRRIETNYYVNGQPEQITSYSATRGGTVINEVVRTFTGLDNATSRLSSLVLSGTVLEEFSDPGLGTMVVRSHP